MVYARLVLFGTGVARRHDPDEVPHAELIQHQRTTAITLKKTNEVCSGGQKKTLGLSVTKNGHFKVL